MTEADLLQIETELDLELPQYYRDFISNYPPPLLQLSTRVAEYELLNSPERIIELNREARSSQSTDWPEEYLVIGESGCGDYYAIDMDDDESSVYFWNHEIGVFADDEVSGSLIEHAGRLVAMYQMVVERFPTAIAERFTGVPIPKKTWWRRTIGW